MENEWKIVIICKPEDTEIEKNSCFCLKPIKKAFFNKNRLKKWFEVKPIKKSFYYKKRWIKRFFVKTDKKSGLCSKPIEKAVFA